MNQFKSCNKSSEIIKTENSRQKKSNVSDLYAEATSLLLNSFRKKEDRIVIGKSKH